VNSKLPAPAARLTMITLGVSNMRASIAFYEALGFTRKFKVTGEAVAFFEAGGTAIGLFPWDQLAQDMSHCRSIRDRRRFAG
jgi:catechol 2,3-dioxygenase-like lactoylglutathione lyase family enzyme